MITVDRFAEILDEMACELPIEFYDELNLGISISPESKIHPEAKADDLYILGEYQNSPMGNGIVIYYGSFTALFHDLSEAELMGELRKTLRHEFRHHMEYRAGERGLELEDERQLSEYLGK